jgi:2,3-bisphosphoglycerate-dependent phosphoglycerate mutase/probable phosphoglycerate mutase
MELYLIRHGQSTNNAQGSSQPNRVRDAALTDTGQQQAAALAAYLADGARREIAVRYYPDTYRQEGSIDRRISRVYCSAMLRALQTAQPVGAALGLVPEVWVDIHEHGGIYEEDSTGLRRGAAGLTRPEIAAQFPDYTLPEAVTDAGWYNRDYETHAVCQGRAISVAARLREWAAADAPPTALISHGTFLDSLLKALLNGLPGSGHFFYHYNTGITRLDLLPDGRLALHYLNRTAHLPDALLTA